MILFIDDILIYSRSPEEHTEHLEFVLQILSEKKLYAKLKKCEFWLQEIVFHGHAVSKDGIFVNPAKVKVVLEWPRPKSVPEIRTFMDSLGIIEVAIPMTKMIGKNEKFVWTAECEESF